MMNLKALTVYGLGILAAASAGAGDLTLQFGDSFSGVTPSSTTPPWVEAFFQDVSPGHVRLTVANVDLIGTENVSRILFNLNPAYSPSQLVFGNAAFGGSFDAPLMWVGRDVFRAAGGGKYDLLFLFNQGGRVVNRFGAGESFTCEISGIPGLTSADFKFQAAGATPAYLGAAQVQRIGLKGKSGWIDPGSSVPWAVPEPGTATLGLLAAGALLARRGTRV